METKKACRNLGNIFISFGKYNGIRLKEIKIEDLDDYLYRLEDVESPSVKLKRFKEDILNYLCPGLAL